MGRWGRWVLGTCPAQTDQIRTPSLLGSHTHNRVPPANVLITWNFDDPNDSHADDTVQAYRYGPNQSSERGTEQEAGSRDVKETFLAFFSESGWMRGPSPPPPPAYSCRRRQSAVSLNSLDLDGAETTISNLCRQATQLRHLHPLPCQILLHLSFMVIGNLVREETTFAHICQFPS